MNPDSPANKHVSLNILRCFFKYIYEQHILTVDYLRIIPKDNYKNQAKLPSTFTDEEINAFTANRLKPKIGFLSAGSLDFIG